MKYLILLFCLYIPFLVVGQYSDTTTFKENRMKGHFFEPRYFGNYFIADHYAPYVHIDMGLGLNLDEYNIDNNRKARTVLYNESIIGTELPFYYYNGFKNGISFSLPVSFSVWFDFTEARTSPILNTDYRFGALEINYIHRFKSSSSIQNFVLKLIPYFHESTHLGDELTIARIQDSLPYGRINVSYEVYDISLTINDPEQKIKKMHSFKFGARVLLDKDKGYYSASPLEVDTATITPSQRYVEPYFHYQYQNPDSKLSFKRALFTISTDLSLRVKYGYPFYVRVKKGVLKLEDEPEAYRPSFNYLMGYQLTRPKKSVSGLGIYFRFYIGPNYHGQFRNIPLYTFLGGSIVYHL